MGRWGQKWRLGDRVCLHGMVRAISVPNVVFVIVKLVSDSPGMG